MMEEELAVPRYDVVIHSAAVSDYYVEGTYNAALEKLDSSEKICSDHEELYLKLTPTPKIIDQIRDVWGFKGTLVKFKLQVGMSDEELIGIAEASRIHSKADLIVANCLEWCRERAIIIGEDGLVLETTREALPRMLYQIIVGDPTC
jgi:phosphopantothenate-cysteine ligase/phosphopantothenoylcysteine decarboxylase/phosphopantothenate--cysteine ligase